jgi:adenylate cyclase class 2
MSDLKEVEIKVRLTSHDVKRLRDELSPYEQYRSSETDVYFNSRFRDLIKTEECLRIRRSSSVYEITWKPPTSLAMKSEKQYWKEELNIAISGSVNDWITLLSRMDFDVYTIVSKRRVSYALGDETVMMLDDVVGAGHFLEVETMSSHAASALDQNRALLRRFGLSQSEVVSIPYRDLVPRASLADLAHHLPEMGGGRD